ncbi:RDD family protein [Oceanomicrobium pacificus]|uniref:RDD family protein n=1 Tax=Oceanomicrobium pacificus TaxID=2692916 RepID=A0A6B0TYU6_9RHOB|nr:RDD family protein [Oceanomicrobium pacificus]MXU66183.1 RDD family protein [Oceanomicrobium pacificus]
MNADTGYASHTSGLPHPELDAQFYDKVPARRLVAWVFDLFIILAISMVVVVLTLGLGIFVLGAIWMVTSFIYRVITIGSKSSTIGMRLVGIELRDRDGHRFTFGQAVVHTTLFFICFAFFVLQLISIVLMVNSRYRQGLPDMIMGSTAINSPA